MQPYCFYFGPSIDRVSQELDPHISASQVLRYKTHLEIVQWVRTLGTDML